MIRRFVCVCIGLALLPATVFTAEPPRPNFVVYISDDHGQRDSSPCGARDVRTPKHRSC